MANLTGGNSWVRATGFMGITGTGAECPSIARSILQKDAERWDEQLWEALLLVYLMACLLALPGNVETCQNCLQL